MSECIVCGAPSIRARGGVLLCGVHAGEAELYIETEWAAGRTVNILVWSARERRRAGVNTNLRLTPEAAAAADRLAAARGLSRNELINQLLVQAGQ